MSYWHIYEFLQPAEAAFVEEHREKATFLKQLCGQNALPYLGDVIADRQVRAGMWIPIDLIEMVKSEIVGDLKDRLRDQLHAKVKSQIGLSRKQRRALLTKRRMHKAVQDISSLEPQLAETHRLPEHFVEQQPFTKYLRGELSKSELTESLATLLCDPEFYNFWIVEKTGKNVLKESFIEIGRPFLNTLSELIEQWPVIISSRREIMRMRREYYSFAGKSGLAPEKVANILGPPPDRPGDAFDFLSFIESPAVHPRLRYISHYMKMAIERGRLKHNDLVDLMHLFHLEDVDVMRCDKDMYRTMRDSKYIDENKLIDRLEDLPEAIMKISSS